jgi:hypothetical protein
MGIYICVHLRLSAVNKSRNQLCLAETSAPKKKHELEAGLMRSQADSERLMEAVVGRMLAGE